MFPSASAVPQAPPQFEVNRCKRDFDCYSQKGVLTLSWLEPDFLPVECAGYQILMDDGYGGDYEVKYDGRADVTETTIQDLQMDCYYRIKIQAVTEQGSGPFTQVSHIRVGTTHIWEEDFDKNGILYAIGTDDNTKLFANPAHQRKVVCTRASDGSGSASLMCNRDQCDSKTLNQPRQFYSIDLGEHRRVFLTHYTIRGNCNTSAEQIRSWWFQGAQTENDWVMLDKREDDKSIEKSGSSQTFEVTTPEAKDKTFRYFRIVQIGKNSTYNHRMHITGFEIYGTLISNLYGNYTAPGPK